MLEAWEHRDTRFIVDHLTDDAVYHAIPLKPITGKEALTSWVNTFEKTPPGRLEIRNQVAGERVVMNERVDRITIQGTQVTLPICAAFDIEGDRIKAWREYFDLVRLQVALRAARTSP